MGCEWDSKCSRWSWHENWFHDDALASKQRKGSDALPRSPSRQPIRRSVVVVVVVVMMMVMVAVRHHDDPRVEIGPVMVMMVVVMIGELQGLLLAGRL